jgi:hypothetical protein
MKALRWGVMALALLAILPSLYAIPPAKMSYQGVLTDGSGAIVPNGNYNLQFSLYTTLTGGTDVWTEPQLVAVAGGVFNVVLGSVTPLNVPFDTTYYLGIGVNGGPELAPRTLLTSAAYALNAPVVAFGASGNTTDLVEGAWTNYEDDTVQINCPGPGYVLVQSSVWVQVFHTAGVIDRFYVGHGTTPTEEPPDFIYVASYGIPGGAAAGTYDISLPVQSLFTVSSAGPVTYYLNGEKSDGSTSTMHFWYANTVATWYSGSVPPPTMARMQRPMKPTPAGH